jgi:type IV pilus assembly protein PilN
VARFRAGEWRVWWGHSFHNMRLDINLANRPYEDARQFWLRWGGALAAVAVFTMVLLIGTVTGWFNARRDRAKIADLHHQIAKRDESRRGAEQFLSRPENRATRDQSQFLNQLIERKAFSWTRVLEDMEKVMPARVHLVSIHPELNEENQLSLKMTVAGDSRAKVIELEQRMEESQHFAQPYIESEHTGGEAKDQVQFEIHAEYIPEGTAVTPATTSPAAKTVSLKGSKR